MRVDGIGDALACAPLVAALGEAGHDVGALLSTRNRDAFASRAFARVHAVERIPWPAHGTTPASREAALAEVRAARYDLALVASEEMDAYAFAHEAGIAERAGFVNGWEKPFKTLAVRATLTRALQRPASAARSREHEAETIFRLGDGLHAEAAPTRDARRLRPLVLDDAPVTARYVVVQLSPKFARAGLDLDAYARIVARLRERVARVILVADDRDFASPLAAAGGFDVRFPSSTAAWKAILGAAAAVVTPDSGAAHVAGMTGVPVVTIFGPQRDVAADIRRWRPWAAPYRTRVLDARERSAAARRAFAEGVADDLATLLEGREAAR